MLQSSMANSCHLAAGLGLADSPPDYDLVDRLQQHRHCQHGCIFCLGLLQHKAASSLGRTINMSLTKKPIKPMTTKPRAVRLHILLNSAHALCLSEILDRLPGFHCSSWCFNPYLSGRALYTS